MQITSLAYRPWLISQGSLVIESDQSWKKRYGKTRELILNAQQKGAVAAIVQRHVRTQKFSLPYLLVKNTFTALETLAKENRKSYHGKIIAITGSVGKTTTKEMLTTLLAPRSTLYVNHNKLNNYRGLIYNVAQCSSQVDYSIYEFGMAKIGTIAQKSVLAQPDIALITDIQPDHLKHHKNIRSIAKTKAEIFMGMNKKGIVVLNRDNDYYHYLRNKAKKNGIINIISFGHSKKSTLQLIKTNISSAGSNITIAINTNHHQQQLSYMLYALGKSSVMNSLAAFAIMYALEFPLKDIISDLKYFKLPEQRGEKLKLNVLGKNIIVLDQRYNSNIASIKACTEILMLEADKKQKTTFIMGDMEELGKFSASLHQKIGEYLKECDIDQILFFGKYGDNVHQGMEHKQNFHIFNTPEELFDFFLKNLREDEIMTIKGSSRISFIDNIIRKLQRL